MKVTISDGQYSWGKVYAPATFLEAGIKLLEPKVVWENPFENEMIH